MNTFPWQGYGIKITGGALFLAALFLFGCGDITEQGGSIFYVNTISGVYKDGDLTNQVDLEPGTCDPGPPPEPEFFSDHFTEVEFINRPLPNAEEQTASVIYIRRYVITYTPLDQNTSTCPLPSPVIQQVNDTQGIPPCALDEACTGTTMTQLYFMPVRTKFLINDLQLGPGTCWDGTVGDQLAYNVQYQFFGENDFGETVTAVADYNFLADNYNNCGGE